MPRILVISSIHPPMWGPEGDHIMHICRQFQAAGGDVHLLTSPRVESNGNSKIHNTIRSWGWRALREIIGVIRAVKPDAIHLMYTGLMYQFHPMITYLPTAVRRLAPGIEFETMITNPIGSKPPANWRAKFSVALANLRTGGGDPEFGTLLRDSSRISVLSEHHLRKLIEKNADIEKKSVLIPPPPILHLSPSDPQKRAETRARFGVTGDEILFAFFGYGYPGKGIETLVAAFGLLVDRLPKIKLMFIGRIDFAPAMDGRPYKTVLLEPAEAWKPRLIAVEYDAGSDEGSTFLRAVDVCVLPFDAGIALNNSSVAGASAHELPIISTFHEHLESAFVNGENVLLCPPKSPDQLAKAMELAATDPALRARLAAGAAKLASDWFSWDRTLRLMFSEKITSKLKVK